jgi:hypothetical protein
MRLEQIKAAIEAGKKVFWKNNGYEVIKDSIGQYLIKCVNGSCIGLTWTDGKTMNGNEEDFYSDEHPKKIDWTHINNDSNGNPRYVCHYLNLLTEEEQNQKWELGAAYAYACKRANALGGRKFHNKQYGGGIVFQAYSTTEMDKLVSDLLKKVSAK